MTIEKIIGLVTRNKYVVLGIAVLFILLILLYIRQASKRRYKREFDGLEIKYNELMSIPVLFKINKANGLAKINPKVQKEVVSCKALFDDINKRQEEIAVVMADAEDAIAFSKLKNAKLLLTDLNGMIEETLQETYRLSTSLETLLEQETQQRLEITELKERFRSVKYKVQESASVLSDSYPTLETQIKEIEHNFSVFEEWMYASDFEKAREISEITRENVITLEHNLVTIPKLYQLAKGLIPQLLEVVSKKYSEANQDHVYIDHLELPKTLASISEVLKDDLLKISQANTEETQLSLIESQKRLENVIHQIEKEHKSHRDLDQRASETYEMLDVLRKDLGQLKQSAEKTQSRFNFENHVETVATFAQQAEEFQALRIKLERMVEEEQIPASTVLISVNELNQDITILKEKTLATLTRVDQANADEVRANHQLLKLHLIINDVQVRIKKRSIGSISESYNSDLERAYGYTKQIKDLLNEDMIDVMTLNATVTEAIDYIYKLHNNVNNLVGVVDMCENALVYANKFRAYVPDIDAELTRAELSFNNGEYTQALTSIINSIDKYRPNVAYEEMILDNAKSAR